MLHAISKQLCQCAMLMIVLALGSPSKAGDPEASMALNIVTFSIANDASSESARMTCAGTLLNPRWMMTAAHCMEPGTQSIRIRCTQKVEDTKLLNRTLLRIKKHVRHDIALLQLEQSTHCLQPSSSTEQLEQAIILTSESRIATSLFTLADSLRHSVVLLEANAHTYIVDDKQCLAHGDSGTPVFTVGNDERLEVAAVLISGTSECPALQILANVSDFSNWVDATLHEQKLHSE